MDNVYFRLQVLRGTALKELLIKYNSSVWVFGLLCWLGWRGWCREGDPVQITTSTFLNSWLQPCQLTLQDMNESSKEKKNFQPKPKRGVPATKITLLTSPWHHQGVVRLDKAPPQTQRRHTAVFTSRVEPSWPVSWLLPCEVGGAAL